MSSIAIEAKSISFAYGAKPVLSEVSFYVMQGEVFCVVGPNGCGKTTLLDCILGLLKVDQGEVRVDHIPLKNYKPWQLARKIAYVPQIHQRSFPYTIKEIVLMGRAHHTTLFTAPTAEDRAIALEALEMVGLADLAEQPYTQISGGQCQLVMIARALAQQPKIIIMDEPTAHLDFKNELLLLETVVDLVRKNGISVVMATHFPNHAFYYESNGIPTRIALMSDRRFAEVGRPCEVLHEENIRRIYGINSKVLDCQFDQHQRLRQIVPLSIIRESGRDKQ
ncbi:MAG: ABC transporter ATP-binding protein [Firmicutes bacterium]|nr:ABC transporter ATP-binding protein [Bacillota bacterium]